MRARHVCLAFMVLALGLACVPSLATGIAALCALCLSIGVAVGAVLEWV